jgi:hypothetical protein
LTQLKQQYPTSATSTKTITKVVCLKPLEQQQQYQQQKLRDDFCNDNNGKNNNTSHLSVHNMCNNNNNNNININNNPYLSVQDIFSEKSFSLIAIRISEDGMSIDFPVLEIPILKWRKKYS